MNSRKSNHSSTALITGITGQDGSLLAEFLLENGYTVHGIKRRTSIINTKRIDHLYESPLYEGRFFLHHSDLTDTTSLMRIISATSPTEIYHLAAQSHVQVSFEMPEYTANVDALGTLRLLEVIRSLDNARKIKFYQASTSEMFGNVPAPQNENTPFQPCSPYGIAKLYAYWMAVNYRQSYDMYVANGILFNHESPVRGETFISRKITMGVAKYQVNRDTYTPLLLGNLDAQRDWGHARDFVAAMWLILQQDEPDDYVIATGKTRTVREFAERSFAHIGIPLGWRGSELNEEGYNRNNGDTLLRVSANYFRPTELYLLRGDFSKAQRILGWKPKYSFDGLVGDMVDSDIAYTEGKTHVK